MNPTSTSGTSGTRNRHWLLNAVNGWRAGAPLANLMTCADGMLALDTLAGAAQSFVPPLGDRLTCPVALCGDDCGNVYVLDSGADRVLRVDAAGMIQVLPQIGGHGPQPQQFDAPRGMATMHGRLVVADTGNHRVQVFSPAPYALLQVWGRPDGSAGDGRMAFRWPWSVATGTRGEVYVADRGNARVEKIALDGTWLATLGKGVLHAPTQIAAGPGGMLAVVDETTPQARAVLLFGPDPGARPVALSGVDQPAAVAFDPQATLYVGSATGLVYRFAPESPESRDPAKYALVGVGVTGLDTPAIDMAWLTDRGLTALYGNVDAAAPALWTIPTDDRFVASGVYVSDVLDSGIEACQWDRVTLLGAVPPGSSVKVECITAALGSPPSALSPDLFDGNGYTFGGGDTELTCLVQAPPGQLLRLRLTFGSGGLATPAIRAVQVYFPRRSYLEYLPAVYQQDDESRAFLDRFLSIFQATFDGFDATIDRVWQLFDPFTVPPRFFDWLAAWLALPTDPAWPLEKKREILSRAVTDYRAKGTVAGLTQAIRDYAGMDEGVTIVEHFRLRNWALLPLAGASTGGARLWSRQFYRRLQVGDFSRVGGFVLVNQPEPAAEANYWGANEFSVFFPADPTDADAAATKVSSVLAREMPAHTKANLVPVLPRFRIGVQATVGVDSSVGGLSRLVLGRLSRLNYDAILNCSPAQADVERWGATIRPAAGVNTRLH